MYHLEKAPVTGKFVSFVSNFIYNSLKGRLRFVDIDEETEKIVAQQSLQDIMGTQKHLLLSLNHPFSQKIIKIVKRLENHVQDLIPGLQPKFQVFVLDNPEPNAFVLPGGQIFVYSGLAKIAKTDDELATVLAHEVKY